ncbi:hypothetical protein ACH5RR_010721 [Cinchona calisaya]|uniref:Uncharacterized protein n=1 Tax=Cinchona calisaya TaxID=153742 RepID=A0ABD3AJR5_9GENT
MDRRQREVKMKPRRQHRESDSGIWDPCVLSVFPSSKGLKSVDVDRKRVALSEQYGRWDFIHIPLMHTLRLSS